MAIWRAFHHLKHWNLRRKTHPEKTPGHRDCRVVVKVGAHASALIPAPPFDAFVVLEVLGGSWRAYPLHSMESMDGWEENNHLWSETMVFNWFICLYPEKNKKYGGRFLWFTGSLVHWVSVTWFCKLRRKHPWYGSTYSSCREAHVSKLSTSFPCRIFGKSW